MAGMGAIIGSLFNRKSALGGASLAGGVTLAGAKDSEPYGKETRHVGTALSMVVPAAIAYKIVKNSQILLKWRSLR